MQSVFNVCITKKEDFPMKVRQLLPWLIAAFLVWAFWGTITTLGGRVGRFLTSIDDRATAMVAEEEAAPATPVAAGDDADEDARAADAEVVEDGDVVTDEEASNGWDVEWYRSPYVADVYPDDEAAADIFAESGVLPEDDAWDRLSARETPLLIAEGAYAVTNVGQLHTPNFTLPYVERNLYIVVYRGLPDDGIKDTDLNQVYYVDGYVRSAGNYNYLMKGAYVSLNWINDQINNGLNAKPNCGADGCLTVTLVVYDLATNSLRSWVINEVGGDWVRSN